LRVFTKTGVIIRDGNRAKSLPSRLRCRIRARDESIDDGLASRLVARAHRAVEGRTRDPPARRRDQVKDRRTRSHRSFIPAGLCQALEGDERSLAGAREGIRRLIDEVSLEDRLPNSPSRLVSAGSPSRLDLFAQRRAAVSRSPARAAEPHREDEWKPPGDTSSQSRVGRRRRSRNADIVDNVSRCHRSRPPRDRRPSTPRQM
jgi:hypothetical protein